MEADEFKTPRWLAAVQAELLEQAAQDIATMGGSGGHLRGQAESLIVDLVERFDTTREDRFGMWPVSKFMASHATRENELKAALEACINAHKTGRYEPLVAAIEAAQNTLEGHANPTPQEQEGEG